MAFLLSLLIILFSKNHLSSSTQAPTDTTPEFLSCNINWSKMTFATTKIAKWGNTFKSGSITLGPNCYTNANTVMNNSVVHIIDLTQLGVLLNNICSTVNEVLARTS